MQLENKICLVTGGTKGIGAATALALAVRGAHVAIAARTQDAQAEATQQEIEKLGRRCLRIAADFSKASDCRQCVEKVQQGLGEIDVLVHAAGGPVNGRLFEITPEQWQAAFDVHVHAIFHLCREVVPAMKKKKEGVILLVSSSAGLRGLPTNLAYQTVKGALPQLTRALARELADDNVRVNCVAPGVIRTDFHASMTEQQKRLNLEHRIPLHREGQPGQVASLALELIQNDYITGETVSIDGGLTMRIA